MSEQIQSGTQSEVRPASAGGQPASAEGQSVSAKGQPASAEGQLASHEYPFFSNRDCAYFPCHDDWDPNDFNCLFCYCPLYALGSACKGHFKITEKGTKDCTNCSLPHRGDAGTRLVKQHWSELVRLTAQRMCQDEQAQDASRE